MKHHNFTDSSGDCHWRLTVESGLPTTSAVMFALGVAGNLAALALLEARRRRRRWCCGGGGRMGRGVRGRRRKSGSCLFRVLVTALVATDLLGTLAVSPVVLAAYTTNTTLVALGDADAGAGADAGGADAGADAGGADAGAGAGDDDVMCAYFGFGMTFLSLSTLSILCAMALERFVSLGFPYFYDRRVAGAGAGARRGYVAVALIYVACALYCACPLAGVGKYVQYCPGTWCFVDMSPSPEERRHLVYTGVYACFTLLVIVCTAVCNVCVICFLVQMHRRQKTRHHNHHNHHHHRAADGGSSRHKRGLFFRRSLSMTEEVEHLLPLVFITVAFCVCSFPLLPSVLKLLWRTLLQRRRSRASAREENSPRPCLMVQSGPQITSAMLDNCTTTAATTTTGLQIHSDLEEPS
ncbi:hypothetical protein CRUP_024444 [Coryphaenoides rupestris]|nr:hypothetical protein CRUP_024444 [Coryphaenoides rupestris]